MLSPAQVSRLVEVGVALLDGVGIGTAFVKRGKVCIHVRRQLSPQELIMLSPEWLAIPPVDMAG